MEQLKQDIKGIKDQLKAYDGKDGKTQDDAIEYEAQHMANAIESYVERLLAKKVAIATPDDVATAGMANSGGPVVAASSLIATIEDKPI